MRSLWKYGIFWGIAHFQFSLPSSGATMVDAVWHPVVVRLQAGQASGRCIQSELRLGRTVGLSQRRGRSSVRHVAPVHPSPDETHVWEAPEKQPGEECRSVTKQRWAVVILNIYSLLKSPILLVMTSILKLKVEQIYHYMVDGRIHKESLNFCTVG